MGFGGPPPPPQSYCDLCKMKHREGENALCGGPFTRVKSNDDTTLFRNRAEEAEAEVRKQNNVVLEIRKQLTAANEQVEKANSEKARALHEFDWLKKHHRELEEKAELADQRIYKLTDDLRTEKKNVENAREDRDIARRERDTEIVKNSELNVKLRDLTDRYGSLVFQVEAIAQGKMLNPANYTHPCTAALDKAMEALRCEKEEYRKKLADQQIEMSLDAWVNRMTYGELKAVEETAKLLNFLLSKVKS